MLERFRRDRNRLINILLTTPLAIGENMWNILSNDSGCLCHVGKLDPHATMKCPQCRNIGRLTKLGGDTVRQPFLLECGKDVGNYLMLTEFPRVQPSIKKKDLPYTITRKLLTKCQEYKTCEPGVVKNTNTTYIAFDEFSNGAIMSFLLERILAGEKLDKHIVKMQSAFICGEDGYYLTERPDVGSFSTLNLTGEVARGIVLQLLVLLNTLSNYDFTYGKPGVSPLMFSNQPCSFDYKGILVSCPYTLKLCDFTNAALTFKSETGLTRVYSTTPLAEAYAKKAIHLPVIATEADKDGRVVYYILTTDTATLFLYLRYMGVALYVHSFDFYCFFVGLMGSAAFYNLVLADEFLLSIWKAMWIVEDYPIVMGRVVKMQGKDIATSAEIVENLKNLRLRCDLVPHLMNRLSK